MGVEQILFWLFLWSIQMVWQGDKINWAWHQTPTSISWWLSTFSLTRLHLLCYESPALQNDLPNQWPIHFARYYCGELVKHLKTDHRCHCPGQSTTFFIRCNCNSFWRCGVYVKYGLLIKTITATWVWAWLRERRLWNVIWIVQMTVWVWASLYMAFPSGPGWKCTVYTRH